jgi:hypothetical protein
MSLIRTAAQIEQDLAEAKRRRKYRPRVKPTIAQVEIADRWFTEHAPAPHAARETVGYPRAKVAAALELITKLDANRLLLRCRLATLVDGDAALELAAAYDKASR